MYRFFLVTFVAFALSAETADGQSFFINAGSVFNEQSAPTRTTQTSIQFGSRYGLTNLFKVYGLMSLQSVASAEAGLQVWPIRGQGRVEPYAFVGYGRYINGGERRSVVPVGAGLAIHVMPHWTVNLEVSRRTTMLRDEFDNSSTMAALSPTIGVTYDLASFIPRSRDRRTVARVEEPLEMDLSRDERMSSDPEMGDDEYDSAEPIDQPVADTRVKSGMVTLRDGMFIMGLADEDPLSMQTAGFKRVTVAAFRLDPYETTNADYRAFLNDLSGDARAAMMPDTSVWHEAGFRFSWKAYFEGSAFNRHPVVAINYEQAKAYCRWKGKRLPSEAEWEYAARAGRAGGIYPWSGYEPRNRSGTYLANYNNGRAGYAADGYAFTSPVNAYKPNPWGLYNMSGNVAEWVEDAFSPTYTVLSDFNPFHEDQEEPLRVVRGGSWASDAFYIGVGVRDAQPKGQASPFVGCRCAQDIADITTNPARAVNRAAVDQVTPEPQEN